MSERDHLRKLSDEIADALDADDYYRAARLSDQARRLHPAVFAPTVHADRAPDPRRCAPGAGDHPLSSAEDRHHDLLHELGRGDLNIEEGL